MNHDLNLSELLDRSSEDPSDRDLVLTITDRSSTDSDNIYVAKAIYKSDTVGLKISIPKRSTSPEGFGQGVKMISIGLDSDKLLSAMAELYGFKLPATSLFKNELIGDYVDLDKFTVHQTSRHANNHIEGTETYKLFFDYLDEGEDD